MQGATFVLLLTLSAACALSARKLAANEERSSEEAFGVCKSGQFLDNNLGKCVECRTCGKWEYTRAECTSWSDTVCGWCESQTVIRNADYMRKCNNIRIINGDPLSDALENDSVEEESTEEKWDNTESKKRDQLVPPESPEAESLAKIDESEASVQSIFPSKSLRPEGTRYELTRTLLSPIRVDSSEMDPIRIYFPVNSDEETSEEESDSVEAKYVHLDKSDEEDGNFDEQIHKAVLAKALRTLNRKQDDSSVIETIDEVKEKSLLQEMAPESSEEEAIGMKKENDDSSDDSDEREQVVQLVGFRRIQLVQRMPDEEMKREELRKKLQELFSDTQEVFEEQERAERARRGAILIGRILWYALVAFVFYKIIKHIRQRRRSACQQKMYICRVADLQKGEYTHVVNRAAIHARQTEEACKGGKRHVYDNPIIVRD